MSRAELKVLKGPQTGMVVPLSGPRFIVGRQSDCQLIANCEVASRQHCAFLVENGVVRLEDMGSSNGTFVNGQRIAEHRILKTGDRVEIGTLSFQFILREIAAEDTSLHNTTIRRISSDPLGPFPHPQAPQDDDDTGRRHQPSVRS